MQIEVAVRAEVLAGKEFAPRARDKSDQLFVAQLFELLRCDGLADAQLGVAHGALAGGELGPRRRGGNRHQLTSTMSAKSVYSTVKTQLGAS